VSLSRWLLILALSSASVAIADDAPTSRPTEPAPAEPAPEPAPEPEAKKKRKKGKRDRGGSAFRLGQLQEDLELDPATMATIRERLGEINAERRSRLKELREAGAEKAEIRKLAKEYRKQASAKLKDILGKDRWKTWREKEKARREARRGDSPDKKKNRANKRGKKNKRAAVSKEQVLKQLKLTEEEAAVVGPLVDGLLETQKLLGQAQRERKKAFQEAALASDDEEALAQLLATYRKEQAEDKKTIAKARETFREVLSPGQEAKAVALGLLD
jgi:hypothetical protein